jgi:hypothetical protein
MQRRAWPDTHQYEELLRFANARNLPGAGVARPANDNERQMTMYTIINWTTREVIETTTDLNRARRVAKAQGFEEADRSFFKTNHPVAFVQDADGCCVDNPRIPFEK